MYLLALNSLVTGDKAPHPRWFPTDEAEEELPSGPAAEATGA